MAPPVPPLFTKRIVTPFRFLPSVGEKDLKPHARGCLMACLPLDVRKALTDFTTENVPDEHLGPGGREFNAHVTCMYGFLQSDPETVAALKEFLKRQGPFQIRLGKLGTFPPSDDGAPLFVEVESPALHRFHDELKAKFPNDDKWPDYHPHASLCYLRPEVSQFYLRPEIQKLFQEALGNSGSVWKIKSLPDEPSDLAPSPIPKPNPEVLVQPTELKTPTTPIHKPPVSTVSLLKPPMVTKPTEPEETVTEPDHGVPENSKPSQFKIADRYVEKPRGNDFLDTSVVYNPRPEELEEGHSLFEKYEDNDVRTGYRMAGEAPPESLLNHIEDWKKRVTPEEFQAVRKYTDKKAYRELNRQVRNCPDTLDCLDDQHRKWANNLDRAIGKAGVLAKPLTLWRKIETLHPSDVTDLYNFMEKAAEDGVLVRLPGYKSCTTAPRTWQGEIVYEILAKSGVWAEPISLHRGEDEFIQGRNTKYRVLGVKKVPWASTSSKGKTQKVIQLEEVL